MSTSIQRELSPRQVQTGDRWQPTAIVEEAKVKARAAGLESCSCRSTSLGRAPNLVCSAVRIMGSLAYGSEVFNCSALRHGNMEVLVRYGPPNKKNVGSTLLAGEIRSCFAMTRPDVASSDATNIRSSNARDSSDQWRNGGPRERRSRRVGFASSWARPIRLPERHKQQSMIFVPMDTPGVRIKRLLTVFGYDHAPHGHAEVQLENVKVPATNILLGEGRGFEIAQGRLGPGRMHHCMRLIGVAERSLEAMCKRVQKRVAFSKPIAEQGTIRDDIALSRIEIDQARLLTLKAAHLMDTVGTKVRTEIAMIIVASSMAYA